jgi:hypothetical protein
MGAGGGIGVAVAGGGPDVAFRLRMDPPSAIQVAFSAAVPVPTLKIISLPAYDEPGGCAIEKA